MVNIERITTSKKKYGGNAYETMIDHTLKHHEDITYHLYFNVFNLKGAARFLEVPKYILKNYFFSKKSDVLKIRSMHTAFFNFKGKGVTIVHHIDSSFSPFYVKMFQNIIASWFLFNTKKDQHIVVVAQYWKQYFLDRGFKNISVAYNGFEIEEYLNVSSIEVESFKIKNGLNGTIIYIGNPQQKKGTHLVCEALKNCHYTLVCSGEGDLELPGVKKLELNFKDYICLLKASSVVIAFSQFLEGWNRVVHEALIVGTPVIGTGAGGMKELLEGGQQVICTDATKLPEKIEWVLKNRKELAVNGQNFAKQFSIKNFENTWLHLLNVSKQLK